MEEGDKPFIVIKFLQDDSGDVIYEAGLTKWLISLDENMIGNIHWPPTHLLVTKCVQKEVEADSLWPQFKIEVKRYYDTYINARNGAKGFTEFSSAYETEQEMGRGKRRKKPLLPFDGESSVSDDEDATAKKKIKNVPAPPLLKLKEIETSLQSQSSMNKNKEIVCVKSYTVKNKTDKENQSVFEQVRRKQDHKNELLKKLKARSNTSGSCSTRMTSASFKVTEVPSSDLGLLSDSTPSHSSTSNKSFSMIEETDALDFYVDSPDTSKTSYNFLSEEKDSPIHCCSKVSFLNSPLSRNSSNNADSGALSSFEKYEVKIERKVDILSSKMDVLSMNLSRLMRFLMPQEKKLKRPENLPPVPVSTPEQLKALESFLEDDLNLVAMCDSFSIYVYAKESEQKSTYRFLPKLLTNSLATQFNFKGERGKKSFEDLKLWEVVQGSVLIKKPEADIDEIKTAVQKWLKNAPWRSQDDGKKSKREEDEKKKKEKESSK